MIAIAESEMNFGDFDETNIFHIEKSRIYKELGTGIKTVEFILKFIKNAKIEWLAGPMAELNARLLKIRKIWRVQIVVLNEELAKERKLIAQS